MIILAADDTAILERRTLATVEISRISDGLPHSLSVPGGVVRAVACKATNLVVDRVVEYQNGVVERCLFVGQRRASDLALGNNLSGSELAPRAASVVISWRERRPSDSAGRIPPPVDGVRDCEYMAWPDYDTRG